MLTLPESSSTKARSILRAGSMLRYALPFIREYFSLEADKKFYNRNKTRLFTMPANFIIDD